jgi:23S rRNA (pseudouridine1915-N3)-methyltransferase
MHIHLISICQKVPDWINEGYQTYVKRLPKEMTLHLKEIPTPKRSAQDLDSCLAQEAKLFIAAIPKNAYVIALDEHGALWDSIFLANKVKQWQMQGQAICLLVGGPDGFHPSIDAHVQEKWSLSKLTLPHALIRVILAEQFYRAFTLINKHPYHRS